jgi:bifunctional non-homologous end joining protein LigD
MNTYGELVVDAEQGITQGALAAYYSEVAPFMLPHVVNRPLSIIRRDGAAPHETIADERGLLALVEELALEIRASSAHVDDLDHPDRLVFELEPGADAGFDDVGRAAKGLRAVFHELELEAFVMTRGRRGLAVIVPVRPELDWDAAHRFGGFVVEALAAIAPARYASATDHDARAKIRLRNSSERGGMSVVPYSTQVLSNAPIALPAFWHELDGMEPGALTPAEVLERVRSLPNDPWERVVGLDQRLTVERRTLLAGAVARALATA